MLTGYKTYIGLFIALLGILGLGDVVTIDEATQVVELTVALVGLCVAVYGRAVAKLQ